MGERTAALLTPAIRNDVTSASRDRVRYEGVEKQTTKGRGSNVDLLRGQRDGKAKQPSLKNGRERRIKNEKELNIYKVLNNT